MFKPKTFTIDVNRAGPCAVVGLIEAHLREAATYIGSRPTHLLAGADQLVNIDMLDQLSIRLIRRRGLGLVRAGQVRLAAEDDAPRAKPEPEAVQTSFL